MSYVMPKHSSRAKLKLLFASLAINWNERSVVRNRRDECDELAPNFGPKRIEFQEKFYTGENLRFRDFRFEIRFETF